MTFWKGLRQWCNGWPVAVCTSGRYLFSMVATWTLLLGHKILFANDHPFLVGMVPVMIIAILAGVGPGILSLVLCLVFVDVYYVPPGFNLSFVLFNLLFLLEGFALLWLVWVRHKARIALANNLVQREHELTQLKHMHAKLAEDSARTSRTAEHYKESNDIMLSALERILDEHERR